MVDAPSEAALAPSTSQVLATAPTNDTPVQWRYAAFISYSSRNVRFARRLHRTLETYRIPKALGTFSVTDSPKAVNRLYPSFRDRDELRGGALREAIEAAVRASAAMIIVCSPEAARSDWVEREIRLFKSLGRGDRIFAIIAEEVPIAADPQTECFPPSLRELAGQGGFLGGDARKGRDGFRLAWMKVLAAIIKVDLAKLIDRDAARRRSRIARWTTLAAMVGAVIGVLATAWLFAADRARAENRQRLTADMRLSFENGDHNRGVSILSHLLKDMRDPIRAYYAPVLAAWQARLPDRLATIRGFADGTIFTLDGRFFAKLGDTVHALPFEPAPNAVVAVDAAGTAFALDAPDRVWRTPRGGEREVITLGEALPENIRWRAGTIAGDDLVVIGEDPMHVELAGPETACIVIDPATGGVAYVNGEGEGWERRYESEACNGLLRIAATPRSDYPDLGSEETPWVWDVGNGPLSPTNIEDIAALCTAEENTFCTNGVMFMFALRDGNPPVLAKPAFVADGGFSSARVCVLPDPAGDPVCTAVPAQAEGMRIFDRYVYLQDRALDSEHPLFRLVDRRDGRVIAFADQDFRGRLGAEPSLVAFSDSGDRLAMVVAGEVLVFAIRTDGTIVLNTRLSATTLGGEEVWSGAMAFIGERRVVVSRSSGLTIAYDLETRSELWRFRLPSSREDLGPPRANDIAVAASPDGARVAIMGDVFLVALDAATGLPLLPAQNLEPPVGTPWQRYDLLAGALGNAVMTADEQERAARLIAWIDDYLWAARPELDVEADTLVARLGPYRGVRRLPPPPTWSLAGDVAMAVGCRTGWQVVDNDVKSFDLLGGITPENGGITLEALAERCGE